MAAPTLQLLPSPSDFRTLREAEQRAAQYALSYATHARLLDLYEREGQLLVAHERTAKTTERLADVLEVAIATVGRRTPSTRPPAPAVVPPRYPLPSILDVKDDDSPTQVGIKTGARTAIEKREAAIDAMVDAMAVAEADARRLRLVAVVLGILVSLGVVAGGAWVAFKFAALIATH